MSVPMTITLSIYRLTTQQKLSQNHVKLGKKPINKIECKLVNITACLCLYKFSTFYRLQQAMIYEKEFVI